MQDFTPPTELPDLPNGFRKTPLATPDWHLAASEEYEQVKSTNERNKLLFGDLGPEDRPPGYEFTRSQLEIQPSRGFGLGYEFPKPEGFDDADLFRLSKEQLSWAKETFDAKQNKKLASYFSKKTRPFGGGPFGLGRSGSAFVDPKTGKVDGVKKFLYGIERFTPFASGVLTGNKNEKIKEIFERVQKSEEVSDYELELLATQMALQENWKNAGGGAKVGGIVADAIPFIAETAAFSGLASLLFKGYKPASLSLSALNGTTRAQKLEYLGKTGAHMLGEATVASTMHATLSGRGYQAATNIRNRESQSAMLVRGDRGEHKIVWSEEEADSWAQALPKGFALAFSEAMSERAGGALMKGLGLAWRGANKLGRGAGQQLGKVVPGSRRLGKINRVYGGLATESLNNLKDAALGALTKRVLSKIPFASKEDIINITQKAGFHGVGGEFTEERFNEIMQYALGSTVDRIAGGSKSVDGLGLVGAAPRLPEMMYNYLRGEKTKGVGEESRQFFHEIIAFTGMGMGSAAINRLYSHSQRVAAGSEAYRNDNLHLLVNEWVDQVDTDGTEGESTVEAYEEHRDKLEEFIEKTDGETPSRKDLEGTPFEGEPLSKKERQNVLKAARDAKAIAEETISGKSEIQRAIDETIAKEEKKAREKVAKKTATKIEKSDTESVVEAVKEADKEIAEGPIKVAVEKHLNPKEDDVFLEVISENVGEKKAEQGTVPDIPKTKVGDTGITVMGLRTDFKDKGKELKIEDAETVEISDPAIEAKKISYPKVSSQSDVNPKKERGKKGGWKPQSNADKEAASVVGNDKAEVEEFKSIYKDVKARNKESREDSNNNIRAALGGLFEDKNIVTGLISAAKNNSFNEDSKGMDEILARVVTGRSIESQEVPAPDDIDVASIVSMLKGYKGEPSAEEISAEFDEAVSIYNESKSEKDRVKSVRDEIIKEATFEPKTRLGRKIKKKLPNILAEDAAWLEDEISESWKDDAVDKAGTTQAKFEDAKILESEKELRDFNDYVESKFAEQEGVGSIDDDIDPPFASKRTPVVKRKSWFRNQMSRLAGAVFSAPFESENPKQEWEDSHELKLYIMKNFNAMLRAITGNLHAINFTEDHAKVPTMQYDYRDKIVWVNIDFAIMQNPTYIQDALREEVIHAALHSVLRSLKTDTSKWYDDVYKDMTDVEIKSIQDTYPGLKDKPNNQTAMEFTRAVIQHRLYGRVTEQGLGSNTASGRKIRRLFKAIFDFLKNLFGNTATYNAEKAQVLSLAAGLVTTYDSKARQKAFPLAGKTLADAAAQGIFEKVFKEKGFNTRFDTQDLWNAVKDTIPTMIDGQINEKGLYDAMHHAIGKLIETEKELFNPNKSFEGARVSNNALSWFLKSVPGPPKDAPNRADVAHFIAVMAKIQPKENVFLYNLSSSEYFGEFATLASANAIHGGFPLPDTDLVIANLENTVRPNMKGGLPSGLSQFDTMFEELKVGAKAVAITDAPPKKSEAFERWMEKTLQRSDLEVKTHFVLPTKLGNGKKKRVFMVQKIDSNATKNGMTTKDPVLTKFGTVDSLFESMGNSTTLDRLTKATEIPPDEVGETGEEVPEPVERFGAHGAGLIKEIDAELYREGYIDDEGNVIVSPDEGGVRIAKNYGEKERRWFGDKVNAILNAFGRTNYHIPSKDGLTILRPLEKRLNKLTGYVDDMINYGVAQDAIRRHQEALPNSITKARQLVERVVAELSNSQMKLMSAALVFQNAVRAYDSNQGVHWVENIEVLTAVRDMLNERVEADPVVSKAMKVRGDVVEHVIKRGISAGVLEPEKWRNFTEIDEHGRPRYEGFMHQEIMMLDGFSNVLREKVKLSEKGAEGKDTIRGEKYDYITHYVASEAAWITTLELRAANKRFLDEINKVYGLKAKLIATASKNNAVELAGGLKAWEKIQELIGDEDKKDQLDALDRVGYFKRMMKNAARQFNNEGISLRSLGRNRAAQAETISRLGDLIDEGAYEGFGVESDPDGNRRKKVLGIAKSWLDAHKQYTDLVKKRQPNGPWTWETVYEKGENTMTKDGRSWSATHSKFHASDRNLHYSSMALSDYINQHVIEDLAEDPTAKVLMAQHARKSSETMILPTPIAKQLNYLSEIGHRRATGDWGIKLKTTVKRAFSAIKPYFLLSPSRFIGYSIRNTIGDIDALIHANPEIFFKVKNGKVWLSDDMVEALADLWEYRKAGYGENIPDDVAEGIRLGAVNEGYFETDVPALRDTNQFKRLFKDQNKRRPAVVRALKVANEWTIKGWFEFWAKAQNTRESVLRLAAYKYYKRHAFDKDLKFGATQRSVAIEIRDKVGANEFAARMSRDLLIDYSNLTIAGNAARSYLIPFWSFTEQNSRRYLTMLDNMFLETVDVWKDENTTAAEKAKLTTKMVSIFGLKLTAFYASVQLFNKAMMAMWDIDVDRDLGKADRNGYYIIGGRDNNGNIILLRNIGSLGETMSWFGLNELFNSNENADWKGTFVNKLYGSLHPNWKILVESLFQRTTYPNVFQSREADIDEIIAQNLGVSDLWREAKGLLLGRGTAARTGSIWAVPTTGQIPWKTLGTVNPNVQLIYNAKEIYEDKMGETSQYGGRSSRPMFAAMKNAVYNNNKAAFQRAAIAYKKGVGEIRQAGRTYEDVKQQMEFMGFSKEEIAAIPESEAMERFDKKKKAADIETFTNQMASTMKLFNHNKRKEFLPLLTAKDARIINSAEGFLADSRQKMTAWYKETVGWDKEKHNELVMNNVAHLSRSLPKNKEKQFDALDKQRRSFEWLTNNGIEWDGENGARQAVLASTKGMRPDTRARWMRKARMNWKKFSEK